jgi:hypothetical protein
MGFFKKGKDKGKKGGGGDVPAAPPQRSPESIKLREQAMENARKARAEIGEETLQKIAAALEEKNRSAGKKARDEIRNMDKDRVAQHLKDLLADRDK